MSIFQMSSNLSNQLNNLSTFVVTNDSSILKFALYCSNSGIVTCAKQLLRQFFVNIFIVVKPG